MARTYRYFYGVSCFYGRVSLFVGQDHADNSINAERGDLPRFSGDLQTRTVLIYVWSLCLAHAARSPAHSHLLFLWWTSAFGGYDPLAEGNG